MSEPIPHPEDGPNPTLFNAAKFAHLKIGLLGGSFNPAHSGHLEMSRYALTHLCLDEVWWLISPQNPLKEAEGMASLADRLQTARALLAKEERIRATDLETQTNTCYTADTLAALQQIFDQVRFVWLMGADNLEQIDQWARWEDIFARVPIAVFRRSGYDTDTCGKGAASVFAHARLDIQDVARLAETKPPAWLVLNNPINLLSATLIRAVEQISKQL